MTRRVTRSRAGAIVASIVVAAAAGTGIWQVGGWGFNNETVTLTAPASATGSVTLSAIAPPDTTSVAFKIDGSVVGTDSSKPYSVSWNSSTVIDGTHSATAFATGTGGSATSSAVTMTTSNGVVAQRFISTGGFDSGTCNSSGAPCATFNYAYTQAVAGDTVEVAAGLYTDGVIQNDATKAAISSWITFQPASGASVTWGNRTTHAGPCFSSTNTDICGRYVKIKGITLGGGFNVHRQADHTVLDGISTGPSHICQNTLSGDDLVLQNSNIGPCDDFDGIRLDPEFGVRATHVSIINNDIHDITVINAAGCHCDGMQITAVDDVNILRNRFWNNADADIIAGCDIAPNCGNTALIEGNYFGGLQRTPAHIAVDLPNSATLCGTVRFNSFSGAGAADFDGWCQSFDSNLLAGWASSDCTKLTSGGGSFTNNTTLFGSVQCGATNTVLGSGVTFGYTTDPTNGPINFAIGCGSPAKDKGNAVSFPTTDKVGTTRPIGAAPDAGAFEGC